MVTTEYTRNFDLDTDMGFLDEIPMTFEVDVETCPVDFCWDGSHRDEIDIHARFIKLKLNDLTLRDNEATAWLGRDHIRRLETWVEQTYEH